LLLFTIDEKEIDFFQQDVSDPPLLTLFSLFYMKGFQVVG